MTRRKIVKAAKKKALKTKQSLIVGRVGDRWAFCSPVDFAHRRQLDPESVKRFDPEEILYAGRYCLVAVGIIGLIFLKVFLDFGKF